MERDGTASGSERQPRDDQIRPVTRLLLAFTLVFLIIASIILYGFPDRTTELFAWTIRPPLTPLIMGSGYLAATFFFIRALFAKRWHQIQIGFLPIALFAALMGLSTALHWDRFNHSHIAFFAWAIIYAITPFIYFGLWVYNRHADPGTPDADDLVVPAALRLGVGIVGLVLLVVGVLFFLVPQLMITVWAWQLTPLTARAITAWWLVMPGLYGILFARESRWSAVRYTLEDFWVGAVVTLIAVVRGRGDLDGSNPISWAFIGAMVVLVVGVGILYPRMERRRRERRAPATGPLVSEA